MQQYHRKPHLGDIARTHMPWQSCRPHLDDVTCTHTAYVCNNINVNLILRTLHTQTHIRVHICSDILNVIFQGHYTHTQHSLGARTLVCWGHLVKLLRYAVDDAEKQHWCCETGQVGDTKLFTLGICLKVKYILCIMYLSTYITTLHISTHRGARSVLSRAWTECVNVLLLPILHLHEILNVWSVEG